MILSGIPESPPGTSYHLRLKHDFNSICSVLSSQLAEEELSAAAIRDCMRLGKYNSSNHSPRRLLVKFNCAKFVNSIVSSHPHLSNSDGSQVYVSPDLTKEERRVHSFLMKERRRLISEGVNSKQIKIRGHNLLDNSRLIGRAGVDGFTLHPTIGDLAPMLSELASSCPNPTSNSSQTPLNDPSATQLPSNLINAPTDDLSESQPTVPKSSFRHPHRSRAKISKS